MRHKKSVMRNMMMVTQLGLSVMVPVFVCILAGSWIDRDESDDLSDVSGISGRRMERLQGSHDNASDE